MNELFVCELEGLEAQLTLPALHRSNSGWNTVTFVQCARQGLNRAKKLPGSV